jgi:hypothetical protein
VRGDDSCGKVQAPCGETVAAGLVFADFGALNEVEKRSNARAYAARAVKLLFGTRIPASIKALSRHARAPRGLIAARYAAKSEAA